MAMRVQDLDGGALADAFSARLRTAPAHPGEGTNLAPGRSTSWLTQANKRRVERSRLT
jgi:hypothetical protein